MFKSALNSLHLISDFSLCEKSLIRCNESEYDYTINTIRRRHVPQDMKYPCIDVIAMTSVMLSMHGRLRLYMSSTRYNIYSCL